MDPRPRRGQGSLLGQLIVVREDGTGHRIGGVHHVRLRHRKRRDVVGDPVEVLGIAGTLWRTDYSATYSSGNRQQDDKKDMGAVHQSIRSEGVFLSYCR